MKASSPAVAWAQPALTTLAVDKDRLGQEALKILLDNKMDTHLLLHVELVIRASSGN